VIFLDDYHVRRINAMRMREVLSQFIKTQLGPLDMVAVMSPLMSVQQVTFTRDLDAAAASVRAFEGRSMITAPGTRGAIRELPRSRDRGTRSRCAGEGL
jgi:hypothetical protein